MLLRKSNFCKDWPVVPLSEAVEFLDNLRKPVKASERVEGEYHYYGANGYQGTIDDYIFDEPLVMLAEDGGHFGNPHRDIAYIAEGKYWVNNHAHVLRPKENVDLKFLYRVLQRYDVSPFIKGATRAKLTKGDASRIPFPLPPLAEQKRIAAILDKADAIRQKRKQAIDLADEFLRSVFLDMFGDPVTNPKGWEVKSLFELTKGKLQNGAYFPKDMYSGDGVEMVHMGDAFYDYIPRGKMKRVIANDKEIQKYKVTTDDILISRRSLNYEGAAKPSLIIDDKEPLLFESSLIRLTPNSDVLNKLYLFGYLSNEIVKEHKIRKFVTGATIKGISQKNLENIEILVPPIDLQTKYEGVVSSISKLKRKIENEDRLATLFSSLSQRSFSGEL